MKFNLCLLVTNEPHKCLILYALERRRKKESLDFDLLSVIKENKGHCPSYLRKNKKRGIEVDTKWLRRR